MIPKRSLIRNYVKAMLKDGVDVGGRVFVGRANSPLFLEELPAVNIHYGDETCEVSVGAKYQVREYTRVLPVVITVVVANQPGPDGPHDSSSAEDFLDHLGSEVEQCFNDDRMLARRLPGFDENDNTHGLLGGSRLTGTLVLDVDPEATSTVLGQSLRYELVYATAADGRRRLLDFESYGSAITKIGTTAETVDPVLLEIGGEF